jgi:hypothetical protein
LIPYSSLTSRWNKKKKKSCFTGFYFIWGRWEKWLILQCSVVTREVRAGRVLPTLPKRT